MSDALNNFIGWGNARRSELLQTIFERTGGKVYQGPFKGMSILPKYSWGDGDTAGKLLGIYEDELHHVIEGELEQTNTVDQFLNIGCAEGYYGLGLAMRKPNVPTALFDINPEAIKICRENASVNGINNVQFNTDCSVENIRSYLSKATHPFIVMDVEGHERILLDHGVIPELNKCSVVVESHDCIVQGTTELIVDRFKESHYVSVISQGAKNPYLDILYDLCDLDKMLLCCESRPSTMSWIWLQPK